MASQKSAYELTREWREAIVSRLDKLDVGHDSLNKICVDIRLQLQRLVEIDGVKVKVETLDGKIRSLEDSRLKLVTVLAVVQVLIAIAFKLWK